MKKENIDIDNLLFNTLTDFESDGNGIDWNSFEKKRKKKRAIAWYWLAASICALICISSYLIFESNRDKKVKVTQENRKNTDNQPIVNNTKKESNFKEKSSLNSDYQNTNSQKTEIKPEIYPIAEPTPVYKDIYDDIYFDISNLNHNNSDRKPDVPIDIIKPIENGSLRLKSLTNFQYELTSLAKKPEKFKLNTTRYKGIIELGYSSFMFSNSFKVSELGKAFIHKDYEKIRQMSERPDGGFDLGLRFGRIYGNFEFLFGINYSRRQLAANYDFNYSEKPLIDADGRIIGYDYNTPKNIRFESRQTFNFVETPLTVRYKLKTFSNRHSLLLHATFTPQFLKGISGQLPNPQFLDIRENLGTENYKNSMFGYEFGLLYGIPLGKSFRLNLQPYTTLNSGFKQVKSFYSDRFNLYGMRLGLSMKI